MGVARSNSDSYEEEGAWKFTNRCHFFTDRPSPCYLIGGERCQSRTTFQCSDIFVCEGIFVRGNEWVVVSGLSQRGIRRRGEGGRGGFH